METPAQTNSTDRLLIILCHLSFFLGVGFLLPLIVYLVKKDDSPEVAYHSKEALNFHISVLIYAGASFLLLVIAIGVVLLFIVGLATFIFSIVAAVKASEGVHYRYPFTMRLVK